MDTFVRLFDVDSATKILDLGGQPFIWTLLERKPILTILNLDEADTRVDWAEHLVADGCNTGLPDKSFDVVFSNSVIEHVGNFDRQKQFAAECIRCGYGYYVQTPNRWFPVDPHTLMPFIHWLPKKYFLRMMYLTPRFLLSSPNESEMEDFKNLRMLTKREMKKLFPEAQIISIDFAESQRA